MVRERIVGQAEQIIGGGLIKFCKRHQNVDRELALAVFVLGIGVLPDVQILGNFFFAGCPDPRAILSAAWKHSFFPYFIRFQDYFIKSRYEILTNISYCDNIK